MHMGDKSVHVYNLIYTQKNIKHIVITMGTKHSSGNRVDTVPQKIKFNTIEEIFTFNMIKLKAHEEVDPTISSKLYDGKYVYRFSINDYFELSTLLFNFDYIKKFEHSEFLIKWAVRNSSTQKYIFTVEITLSSCSFINMFLCVLILLDVIPHKYFNPSQTFDRIVNDVKQIASLHDARGSLRADILVRLQFINLNGDILVNTSDPEIRKKYEKREKMDCIVCMEKPKNIIFLPCKHFSSCETCSVKDFCPICRAEVANRIQVFDC